MASAEEICLSGMPYLWISYTWENSQFLVSQASALNSSWLSSWQNPRFMSKASLRAGYSIAWNRIPKLCGQPLARKRCPWNRSKRDNLTWKDIRHSALSLAKSQPSLPLASYRHVLHVHHIYVSPGQVPYIAVLFDPYLESCNACTCVFAGTKPGFALNVRWKLLDIYVTLWSGLAIVKKSDTRSLFTAWSTKRWP